MSSASMRVALRYLTGAEGKAIRIALIRHDKTGTDVAAAVGLGESSFSRVIHGHRRVSEAMISAIWKAIA